MRCSSCDRKLGNREATRKTLSGQYLDLCDGCYESIKQEVPTTERDDIDENEGE